MKIIYHPFMLETYDSTPAGAPGRLESAVEILSKHPDYEFIEPPLATEEQILRAHSQGLIERVKRNDRLSRMSSLAAGGAIKAGEIITEKMDVEANVKWGARIMQNYEGKLEIVAIVTGVKGASVAGNSFVTEEESSGLPAYSEDLEVLG